MLDDNVPNVSKWDLSVYFAIFQKIGRPMTRLLSTSWILLLSFLNFILPHICKTDQEGAMRLHILHALHHLEEGRWDHALSKNQCPLCILARVYTSVL